MVKTHAFHPPNHCAAFKVTQHRHIQSCVHHLVSCTALVLLLIIKKDGESNKTINACQQEEHFYEIFWCVRVHIGPLSNADLISGWLFKLELTVPSEIDELMDEAAYEKFLKESEE